MENIKREELEKLVGIDKVNTFYNIEWVMFDIIDNSILEDLKKLLLIKRKPNRK